MPWKFEDYGKILTESILKKRKKKTLRSQQDYSLLSWIIHNAKMNSNEEARDSMFCETARCFPLRQSEMPTLQASSCFFPRCTRDAHKMRGGERAAKNNPRYDEKYETTIRGRSNSGHVSPYRFAVNSRISPLARTSQQLEKCHERVRNECRSAGRC